jgi:AcrR family transcriptional regulator
MAQVASERGYAQVRVRDVLDQTGISRRTFYVYFGNLEECFFATYDAIVADVAKLIEPAPSEPKRLLTGLLDYFSAWPAHTRVLLIEILSTGPSGAGRYEDTIAMFATALAECGPWQPGRCHSLKRSEQAQAVIGAMLRIVQRELVTQGGDGLPSLLPALTTIATRVAIAKGIREREASVRANEASL